MFAGDFDQCFAVLLLIQSLEQELLTVLIITVVISFDNSWLVNQPTVVSGLLHIWVSPDFHDHHRRIVRHTIFTDMHTLVFV